ncbi:lysin B [Gordonia phage Sapo]|nr:lysin B [Gordonia phage Sapo]
MTVRVVLARGTSESQDRSEKNLLWQVARLLPHHWVKSELAYPASISFANQQRNLFGVSGDRSVLLGVEALRRLVQQAPPDDRFVLLGYSLGSLVVCKFVESLEPALRHRVLAVGQVANPLRAGHLSAGGVPKAGCGLAGEFVPPAWLSSKWLEVARADDLVTSASRSSLFRPYVEEVLSFSVRDPSVAVQKWFWDTLLGKNHFPLQALYDGRFETAVREARGYPVNHTLGYGLKEWREPWSNTKVSGTDFLAGELVRLLRSYR